MAALVEGQQYGLSSQGNYSNNKSLIFVKLTDSALKAIGELVKSGKKLSMCPTIQFQGNQGVISLPRPPATNPEYVQEFGFTLSNVEADGPQGSFECIQQSGSRSLHSLGCMLHKMHIHANEDSYESTRVKMASVEKESKMNCTKVIKASGPYVGRKVKVKRPTSSFIPPPKSSTPPPPPIVSKPIPKPLSHNMPTSNTFLGTGNSSSSSSSSHSAPHSASHSVPNSVSHSAPSSASHSVNHQASFKPIPSATISSPGNPGPSSISSSSVGPSTTSTSCPPSRPAGNPEIMRRPYRERVIHLLALRSYKKPELLARLMKDGIKEKDKKGLSALLSQLAVPKGNTFSLIRFIWNEVQDDWPFYTQEEKELLKRRRSQIASPPVETDHPSPSAIHSSHSPPFPNSQPQKRPHPAILPGHPEKPKKQRISHYNSRSGEIISNPSGGNCPISNGVPSSASNRLGDSMPTTLSAKSESKNGSLATNRSPPFSHSPKNGLFRTDSSSGRSPVGLAPSPGSSCSKESALNNRTPNNSHRSRTPTNIRDSLTVRSPDCNLPASQQQQQLNSNHQKSLATSGFTNFEPKKSSSSSSNGSSVVLSTTRDTNYRSSLGGHPNKIGRPRMTSKTNGGSTGSRGSSPQSSPESQDSVEYRGSSSLNSSPTSTDVPDYVSKYVGITSRDQRAKYKSDFNAEYNEYRKLHAAIEQVKRRFEALEYELRNSTTGSEEWHRIKSQILQEYEENHRGHQYRETKRRLNYLHDKLSHIKRLVVEYDQSVPLPNDGSRHHRSNGQHHSQQRLRKQQLAIA